MGLHFIYLRQDTQKSYTMKSFLIAALAATLLVQTFAEPEPKNVITCTICTDLIQILDDSITDQSTVEQVLDVLHTACDFLVGMEQECYNFVDTNVEKIIDLLVNQYLSPEAICNELTLCP